MKDSINLLEKYKNWVIGETKKRKYDLKLVSVHFLEIGDLKEELQKKMIF